MTQEGRSPRTEAATPEGEARAQGPALVDIHPWSAERFRHEGGKVESSIGFGFPSLEHLRIYPDTITVVTAPTGGGKTSFLLNVLLNLLEQHPDERFVFWTYEESGLMLLAKLCLIAASRRPDRHEFADFQDFQTHLQAYFRGGALPEPVRASVEQVEGYLKAGRLLMIDAHATATVMAEKIKELALDSKGNPRHDRPKAVFLDYIQQVPADSRESASYREIKVVVNALRRAASEQHISMIVGAQVTDRSQINTREGRDIEMDAALWIHLEDPAVLAQVTSPKRQARDRRGSPPPLPTGDSGKRTVLVQKHRYGAKGGGVTLYFDGRYFLFRDPNDSPTAAPKHVLPSQLYLHPSLKEEA